MTETRYFTKDDGRKLPVDDRYILPFLSPTSSGTNYWDPPPPGAVTDRQRGRVLLQLHQILHFFSASGVDLQGKRLLDIGTGNGLIPRLLLEFSKLDSAVGADPYLNSEHKTSWQAHDQDEEFLALKSFINANSPDAMDHEKYLSFLGYEHYSQIPGRVCYEPQPEKQYRFAQIGAHDLAQLDEKFDVFYMKAIDHIPDWDGIFAAIAGAATEESWICIKHFSFFSYLGPHRYATTNIPWGHLLLTDDEYRRFAQEFHGHRADQMVDFYFRGLAYPRTTMSDLIRMARKHGFVMHAVVNEPLRNISDYQHLADEVDDFWEIVAENWPGLSAEEMMSGRYHIVLRRVA